MKDPWRLLGIPRGSNANSIRKAYAAKIKQFHPEEHPEEFKQLNEAYRQAIADTAQQTGLFDDNIPETDIYEPQTAEYEFGRSPEDATTENNAPKGDNFDYDEFKTKPAPKGSEYLTPADILKKIQVFITIGEARLDVWHAFFNSERFIKVMDEPVFIGEFTELLRKHRHDFNPAIYKMVRRQYFKDNRRNPNLPPYRQLAQILKEQLGLKRYLFVCVSFIVKHIWLIILISIFASLGLAYLAKNSNSNKIVSEADSISNSTILENVETYIKNEYPDIDIRVFESLIEDDSVHTFECTLPEYNNLVFKAYASPPFDLSSIKDNLAETAVEYASDLFIPRNNCSGVAYYYYNNDAYLEEMSDSLMALPEKCANLYPFVREFNIKITVLPQQVIFPFAKITAYELYDGHNRPHDREGMLKLFKDMRTEYTIRYEPWANLALSQENSNVYLSYGQPVTVQANDVTQTFEDVRAENGVISAGDIYRLCKHLDIPFLAKDNRLNFYNHESFIVCSEEGTADIGEAAQALGITIISEN